MSGRRRNVPRKKADPKTAAKKLGRSAARAVARPVKARMKQAEPTVDALDQCRAGKHPVGRRIGSGCAVCGSLTAWRS